MSLFELPLHPRLVHFPIALLLLGALASLVYDWRRYPWLQGWGLISLLAGWLLTVPAIVTGLIDKEGVESSTLAGQLTDLHTTTMFVMWGLYGLALYWQYVWRKTMDQGRRRWIWAGTLILASLVLIAGSHIGARLVFELGVGVRGP